MAVATPAGGKGPGPADVEFFWDPVCPWAWVTSRWVVNVLQVKPVEVDWRFISLRMVNEGNEQLPLEYRRGHERGLQLLRVAAAVRAELGRGAVLPLYSALGRRIHDQGAAADFDQPSRIEGVLLDLGYPVGLAGAAGSTVHDDTIASDTREALDRCGGNIGTPVLSFSPPDGPSFFGPVISRAPKGQEAVDLWDAVVTLGRNPHFSELKRSVRGRPEFDY